MMTFFAAPLICPHCRAVAPNDSSAGAHTRRWATLERLRWTG